MLSGTPWKPPVTESSSEQSAPGVIPVPRRGAAAARLRGESPRTGGTVPGAGAIGGSGHRSPGEDECGE